MCYHARNKHQLKNKTLDSGPYINQKITYKKKNLKRNKIVKKETSYRILKQYFLQKIKEAN